MYLCQMADAKTYSPGLFARNFLLLLILMFCCLGLWFAVFLQYGVAARAYEMSQRVASAVNLTSTALRYAKGPDQSQLLADLSRHQSLDVHARMGHEILHPLPDEQYWRLIESHLRAALGPDSLIAWEVNHAPAFWVSFTSNGHPYWLAFERHKVSEITRMHWASWIFAAALLSMIGAWISTRFLNRPLDRLAQFAQCLSKGHTPVPLPENGAHEIKLVNKSFNHMFQALRGIESDRELMLAGLSHDLRTPLTRMRLEIEMSTMPEYTRTCIDRDLEQVDCSINQLIEYARASSNASQNAHENFTPVIDISQELTRLVTLEAEQYRGQDASLKTEISINLRARIDPLNLQRILSNLLENAKRYGRNASGVAEIFIRLHRQDQKLLLEISDSGPGITPLETEILMRPFYRGNRARTDCVGTGLGLAITERLVKQAHGTIRLSSFPDNIGLHVLIFIPAI